MQIGVDIINIERIVRFVKRHPGVKSLTKVFTIDELKDCLGEAAIEAKTINSTKVTASGWQSLATRFAAKEAVAKALGTGFSKGVFPSTIVVSKGAFGRPTVTLKDGAKVEAERQGLDTICLSLAHEKDCAIAFVTMTRGQNE